MKHFKMPLWRCSEAGSVFPNLPTLLLEDHPVVHNIRKYLQGLNFLIGTQVL